MADWRNLERIGPHSFQCGYCGRHVSSREGFQTDDGFSVYHGHPVLFICPGCNSPTFFAGNMMARQTPAPILGEDVAPLPDDVAAAYLEARQSTKVQAFTSAVLMCRKILMHAAVQSGAKAGDSFVNYVEHLSAAGYIPPNGKVWVDKIRQKGNEANHEIVLMTREDAQDILTFTGMLLKFMYEFPSKAAKS